MEYSIGSNFTLFIFINMNTHTFIHKMISMVIVVIFWIQTLLWATIITPVSINSGNILWNADSRNPSISADGRYVVFQSTGTNLVPWDINPHSKIFLRDTLNNTITLISTGYNGPASDHSQHSQISDNGEFVVFESNSNNLVVWDDNGVSDIFLYTRNTQQFTLISTGYNGHANGASYNPNISADGNIISFSSEATNIVMSDSNNESDVFVYNRTTGITDRISVSSTASQADAQSSNIASISDNGRYIAFWSPATNLVTGDTNNVWDVFIRDRSNNTTERVSVSSTGVQAIGASSLKPRISADGGFIIFESHASNLVTDDTNSVADIFLRDISNNITERISVSSTGMQANGSSTNSNISADGRFIVFQSNATNLVTGDTNGFSDVFIYDTDHQTTERISVTSTGAQANGVSYNPTISANGRYISFATDATNLLSGDTNGFRDIVHVARIPSLTLYGNPVMNITQWSNWSDPAARYIDPIDGDYSMLWSNTVNTAVPGTYTVTYTRTSSDGIISTATRTVIVSPLPQMNIFTNSGTTLITNQNPPRITGTGTTETTITIMSGNTLWTGVTSSTGSWSITLPTLLTGQLYNFTGYATNAYGTTTPIPFKILIDTKAPIITLSGANPMTIVQNSTFVDPGASWSDNIDGTGNIFVGNYHATWSFQKTGSVNTNIIWTYTISYKKVDISNNSGTVTRTINVIAPTSNPTSSNTWPGWYAGGGGWGGLVRDNCPLNEDYSPSYYDRTCGTKPSTSTTTTSTNTNTSISNILTPTSSWYPRPIWSINSSTSQSAMNDLCKPYSDDGYSMDLYESSKVYKKEIFIICWMSEYKLSKFNRSTTFRGNDILRKDESTKFMYNFMNNVLDFTPKNTQTDCNYNDATKGHADLWWYITNACKIWLYEWTNKNKSFNPTAKLNVSHVINLFSTVNKLYNKDLGIKDYSTDFITEINELQDEDLKMTRIKAAHALYKLSQLI
jgi:hypothetical protein